MIKILLATSKSMDFSANIPADIPQSEPVFISKAEQAVEQIRSIESLKLKKILSLSDKLLSETMSRYENWSKENHKAIGKPAGYVFSGDVYKELRFSELDFEQQLFLQNKVYIISGLYGLLTPFTTIMPYRLEIASKVQIGNTSNMYSYWKNELTKYILDQSEGKVINLAGCEYSKAIDKKLFKGKMVDVKFHDLKDGKLKTVAIYSKRARGLMTRFIAENNIESVEGLKSFSLADYSYYEEASTEDKLVFVR